MNEDTSISAHKAANLVKGDLEAEIMPIAQSVADKLEIDGSVASWALISKHFILRGSQDSIGEWKPGDDVFGGGFEGKPLSEMLDILAESNHGGPNFALKIARDGRVLVNRDPG